MEVVRTCSGDSPITVKWRIEKEELNGNYYTYTLDGAQIGAARRLFEILGGEVWYPDPDLTVVDDGDYYEFIWDVNAPTALGSAPLLFSDRWTYAQLFWSDDRCSIYWDEVWVRGSFSIVDCNCAPRPFEFEYDADADEWHVVGSIPDGWKVDIECGPPCRSPVTFVYYDGSWTVPDLPDGWQVTIDCDGHGCCYCTGEGFVVDEDGNLLVENGALVVCNGGDESGCDECLAGCKTYNKE